MLIFDNAQLVLGAAACLGVLILGLSAYLPKSGSGLPLPPSPPTSRFLGYFLPPTMLGSANRSSAISYGSRMDRRVWSWPLITIRSEPEKSLLLPVTTLSILQAIVDIMEKQGGSLVDHPRFVAGEILSGELSIIFAPAGSRWRRMRRFHKSAEEYQPLQISHAKNLVFDILEDPANFQNHAATYVVTTITKIVYGKATPTSATDPEVTQVCERFIQSCATLALTWWTPSHGSDTYLGMAKN
ncbi:hypothetical protein EDB19DRAFT_1982571 [Suillus lakei]|nr:hypothetical protein EDB19DRAFT_1982571 [Suillus lakei]